MFVFVFVLVLLLLLLFETPSQSLKTEYDYEYRPAKPGLSTSTRSFQTVWHPSKFSGLEQAMGLETKTTAIRNGEQFTG